MIRKVKNSFLQLFIVKLIAFFAVVFLSDLVIGRLLKKYYFKQESGYYYQTTYAIDKTEADILIFGSSRAANLFNPEIFEKHFNMSCFNIGRDGHPLFYHYALLKANLKRHLPKIVILSFDAGNFSIKQEAYDRLSSLLPYYSYHPEIRPIVDLKGPNEKVKMLSAIYPYNSLLLPIIAGNSAFSKTKYATIKGYVPLKEIIKGPLKTLDYTIEKELDTIKVNTYRAFLKECRAANIKLYVVCPPYMINAIGVDYSITTAKKIAQEYNISFFDYSRDTSFINKPLLFADFRHLNEKGVELLANTVIVQINNSK
ncbi:MAG: hypothetical protein ABI760_10840 [Ferruginibacter sp.]